VRAYHFLREDMTTMFGNEPPWKVGETRTVEGKCILCTYGYHSSPTWFDALRYATGPVACKVEVSRPVERDSHKQVSQTRTLLDYRDASHTLRRFACDCAERILISDGITNYTLWRGIKTLRRWLEGKATDSERDWAAVDVTRVRATSLGRHEYNAAYIVSTAMGFGAASFEEAVSVAVLVADQFIGHAIGCGQNLQAEAWAKQHLGQLLARLFRSPNGEPNAPVPKPRDKNRHAWTEVYVLRGFVRGYSEAGYFSSIDIFEKVHGSKESAPFVRAELFPHGRILVGLPAWNPTPKVTPVHDGSITKLPVVRIGEELLR